MAPKLMFLQIGYSTNQDNSMHLGLFKCGINWLDVSVVIQLSDLDTPQRENLELLADEALEASDTSLGSQVPLQGY